MKHTIESQLAEVNKIITYWQNIEEAEEFQFPHRLAHAKHNRELYEAIRETLTSVKEKK